MTEKQKELYEQILAMQAAIADLHTTLMIAQYLSALGVACVLALAVYFFYPDRVTDLGCLIRDGWFRLGILLRYRTVEYRSEMIPGTYRQYRYYKLHLILGYVPIWYWRTNP